MYELTYSKSAVKFLKKIPKEKQDNILSVLERTRLRPEKHFKRLVGDKSYKLRISDYRVIADIYRSELRILVVKVGHRRNIHK